MDSFQNFPTKSRDNWAKPQNKRVPCLQKWSILTHEDGHAHKELLTLQGGFVCYIFINDVDKTCVLWLCRTDIKMSAEWERNFWSFRNWLNNGMASIKIRNWFLLLGRNRVYEHRQIGSMGRCFVTSRRTNKTTVGRKVLYRSLVNPRPELDTILLLQHVGILAQNCLRC